MNKKKAVEALEKLEENLEGLKGFCPTGPGGGIDNSCGRGRGKEGSMSPEEEAALEEQVANEMRSLGKVSRHERNRLMEEIGFVEVGLTGKIEDDYHSARSKLRRAGFEHEETEYHDTQDATTATRRDTYSRLSPKGDLRAVVTAASVPERNPALTSVEFFKE